MESEAAIISEAFRRAQMANRLLPILADFPTCVTAEEVTKVLLPTIRRDVDTRTQSLCVPTSGGDADRTFIAGCSSSHAGALTYAGDAVMATFLLRDTLSQQ